MKNLVQILLLIICSQFFASCTGQDTLASRGSFLRFSGRPPAPHRVLRLSFRTSELNGVLVYIEGCDRPDYLLIRLVNGTVEVRLSLEAGIVETRTLGEFLNNNEPHVLTVYQNPQLLRFQYALDALVVVESYASGLVPAFGPGGVFVGGAPPERVLAGIVPLVNGTSFIGCIESVFAGSGNFPGAEVPSSSLLRLEPIEVGGVIRPGCPDPCLGMDCGAGHCVARLPDIAFCDCRGSGMLGENCTEDPASHQLTFEPGNGPTHYCHQILPQPYIDANSVTLQLIPPIPSEGTLLVAHPDDGTHSFSLHVEARRIIFEYQVNVNVTRRLALETELDRSNTTYRVDLTTSSQSAELTLLNVSASQWVTVLERRTTEQGMTLYPRSTIFTTVCVGGSLLEYDSYIGTIQSAFYSFNSLLEERNFCQLDTEGAGRSDLIVFVENNVARELVFERFPLRSHRIVFQHRSQVDHQVGLLAAVKNDPYEFFVAALGPNTLLLYVGLTNDSNISFMTICPGVFFDGEWHTYQITLDETGEMLTLTVDQHLTCAVPTTGYTTILANSALRFGLTNDVFMGGGNDGLAIFTGCISGIELQRTPNSEVFRPNLEAVPRRKSDAFEVGACYHCTAARERSCGNGRVCTDRAAGVATTCECPDGVTGEMCNEPIGRMPSLTCPAPPIFTPSTSGGSGSLCPASTTIATQEPTAITTPIQITDSIRTTDSPQTTDTPLPTSSSPTGSRSPTGSTAAVPTSEESALSAGVWAGLGVAIALALIVLVALLIGICVMYRRGAGIRGFYRTNESNSQDAPMIRYSASLRQLSSEVVSIEKESPNELSWSHKNGDHINGGPPSKSTHQINRTSVSRDKEFYL